MSTQVVYAVAAFIVAIVVYRPFITRLDRMRYIIFSTAATFATLLFFVSTLSDTTTTLNESSNTTMHIFDDNNNYFGNAFYHQWKAPAVTISTIAYNSINESSATIWKDVALLILLSATSISFCGILSRWDFPILHVKPNEPAICDFVHRHVSSVAIILLGSYSNVINNTAHPHQVVPILCPAIAMLYLVAGPYLFRRWGVVVATACLIAYIGHVSTTPSTYNKDHQQSVFASWTVADWLAVSFIFAGSTAALDYWDAIMSTYPYLSSDKLEDHVRMQDPMRMHYWIHLTKTIVKVSSEAELDPEPIEDLKAAIRSLGHNGRSWKTMSILFPSNLRQEMCVLYAWFRVCDDIVDDMDPKIYGTFALDLVRKFLTEVFHGKKSMSVPRPRATTKFGKAAFHDPSVPKVVDWDYYAQYLNETQLATLRGFSRLAPILCPKAAFALTDAWKIDIHRQAMKSQDDLLNYAGLISGRFAELCTCVIMYKSGRGNWSGVDPIARNDDILKRARATGQCLQLINIARDLIADSLEGRCYVPLQYMPSRRTYKTLKDSRDPSRIGETTLKSYAIQILKLADCLTAQAQVGIDGLPYEVRDGVRAAFEIYSAISPAIRNAQGFPKRAKVPKRRQQMIAFSCIYGFHPGLDRFLRATRYKLLMLTKLGEHKKLADIALPSK